MKFETPLFVIMICVLAWSLTSVLGRIILLEYNLAPATFTFIQMLSGGFALVLLNPKRIKSIGFVPLKQLHTWGFGSFRVISASFYSGSFLYLTATNTAFLGGTAISLSVIFVWLLLGRKPKWIELPGHIVLLISWYFLAMEIDGQFSNPGIWLLLVSQVFITFAIILGETHPLNQNNNSGDTLYLTGMLLVASAVILLSLSYAASLVEAQLPADYYPILRGHIAGFVLRDMFNPYAWICGFLTGASFRAAAIYYSLRAVKLASSEFYLGSMAMMPFVNMGLEAIATRLGYLPYMALEPKLIMYGIILSAASFYISFFKRGK
ncbi:MAG: hypothetical protein COB24_00895 [Hyphomicrobiales bacterium]|nr:MAG: hypothetical protein COB24_00895 [Hyphomicrobiales bacterium]